MNSAPTSSQTVFPAATEHDQLPLEHLSAFVVCFNEEDRIQACLESLSLAGEIVVVDSFSTDSTPSICRSVPRVNFLQRPWSGYLDQKRYACEQTTKEWVLFLDADEELSPELQAEIRGILAEPPKEVSGYEMPRVTYFLGRWWDDVGWSGERRTRLFRRGAVKWVGREPHENVDIHGALGSLKGSIRHYSYENISDQVKKLSSHAYARAKADISEGRRCSVFSLLGKPAARFVKFLIFKQGWRAGIPGLIVAWNEAHYAFLKGAYAWEIDKGQRMSREQGTDVSE